MFAAPCLTNKHEGDRVDLGQRQEIAGHSHFVLVVVLPLLHTSIHPMAIPDCSVCAWF